MSVKVTGWQRFENVEKTLCSSVLNQFLQQWCKIYPSMVVRYFTSQCTDLRRFRKNSIRTSFFLFALASWFKITHNHRWVEVTNGSRSHYSDIQRQHGSFRVDLPSSSEYKTYFAYHETERRVCVEVAFIPGVTNRARNYCDSGG